MFTYFVCISTYFFISVSCLTAEKADSCKKIYSHIDNIYHPTIKDYYLIQNCMSSSERPILSRLKDFEQRTREFKIIGNAPNEYPQEGMIAVNCDASERENCVITYSSFNQSYKSGQKRLLEHIARSDFKGHILYRLGGWPNTAGGSLVLAHVPYAFKVAFFKEAQRLGYKRILWLDASVVPLVSLNEIFKRIKHDGQFVMGCQPHTIGQYTNAEATEALGISLEEAYYIPSCSSGLFGVDVTTKRGNQIIDLWYKAAFDKYAFYTSRPEQNALSLILYKLGVYDFVSLDQLAHGRDKIKPDSLFLLDRGFVHRPST